jgi:hypothetical protein
MEEDVLKFFPPTATFSSKLLIVTLSSSTSVPSSDETSCNPFLNGEPFKVLLKLISFRFLSEFKPVLYPTRLGAPLAVGVLPLDASPH